MLKQESHNNNNGCDATIHVASWHERVVVCEACEQAPAAFLCKADAASLCTACDADIHSANPLARRHQRVPIGFLTHQGNEEEDEDDETSSWLLQNPLKNNNNNNNNNNGFFFGVEVDEFLDFVEYNNSSDQNQFSSTTTTNDHHSYGVPSKISYGGDSVVPVQHISVSSMDVGVVPDSTMSEMSVSNPRTPKGTIDLFNGATVQMPTQLSPMDREARVLRYREKKKNRKFEKTIRYASRKAYAETRPRIKGRFAKRTDIDLEVDQMFSTSLMGENVYGIVPSY